MPASPVSDSAAGAPALSSTLHTRPRGRPAACVLLAVVLAFATAACDGDPTGPRPATVEVTAPAFEVELGGELQLSATVEDGSGNTIPGAEVEWVSLDPSRAEVDGQGRVTGVGLGTVTIEARSGPATGSITLEVIGPAPQIHSIEPAVLREGEDAFIEGEGFSPVPDQNRIRIGGRLATVVEASETSLVVRVPAGVCFPEGTVPVTASLGGAESEPVLHPFDSPEADPMAVGEYRLLTAAEGRCLRLGSAGSTERYIFGAQSTTPEALSTVRLFVDGRRAGAIAAAESPAHGHPFAEQAGQPGAAAGHTPGQALPDRWEAHRTTEARIRAGEARALAPVLRGGGIAAARAEEGRLAAARSLQPAVPATVQPGDTVNLSVPDISSDNFCQEGVPIRAVVRRVGAGSIWVEDIENPDRFTPAQYDALSDLYDDEILEELTDFFGEPTDLDDNDRIVIVISQAVNAMSTFALGFVVSVDFFPNQCPAGNGGEYYYARSPDPEGMIPGPDGPPDQPYTVSDAAEDAPVLLAHETTHIIQFGRRIHEVPGAEELPTIWELEGQATFAEEVVGFRVRDLGPRQDLGFSIAFPPSSGPHYDWFSTGFVDLAVYYGFESRSTRTQEAPHECGWLHQDADGPCDYRRLPYGVSWSFLRWISDHLGDGFSGGEQEFHRRMIDHTQSGFRTLEDVLGQPVPPLLGRWAASLYTDGRLPAGADPTLTFPSWDLRSIGEGLVAPARLQPIQRTFNSFSDERRIAAGASTYYLLEGASRPGYTVELRPHTGSELPGFVQLWVVRLQ